MMAGAIIYLLARIVAAIATFISLYLFIRESTDAFSVYVECTTAGSILNGFFFQGTRMAYQRFNRGEKGPYFNALAWSLYLCGAMLLFIFGSLWISFMGRMLTIVCGTIGVATAQGWFELRLEYLRLHDRRVYYAFTTVARSVLLLGAGILFSQQSSHEGVFVVAAVLSNIGAGFIAGFSDIKVRDAFPWSGERSRDFVQYAIASGVAVTATLLAALVDRLAVAHFFDYRITAAYGLASSISQAGIAAVGQSIGLVSLPMMLQAHGRSRRDYGTAVLLTGDLHMLLSLPAALCSILVSFELFTLFGSPEVQVSTACYSILGVATLLQSISTYYLAQVLQVENRVTAYRNILVTGALATSLGSPFLCILVGVQGASIANLSAQAICFLLAWREAGFSLRRTSLQRSGLIVTYIVCAVGAWALTRVLLPDLEPLYVFLWEATVLGAVSLIYMAAYYKLIYRRI